MSKSMIRKADEAVTKLSPIPIVAVGIAGVSIGEPLPAFAFWMAGILAYDLYSGVDAKPTLEELREYGFDTNDPRVKPAEEPGRYRIPRHILYHFL